jgi:hypothetical protein
MAQQGDGFPGAAEVGQKAAQVGMGERMIRGKGDCPAQAVLRLLCLASGAGCAAE